MKRIKQLFMSLALLVGIGLTFIPASAGAINVYAPCDTSAGDNSSVCAAKGDTATSFIKTLVNTLLFILGAISVIIIIFAGIQYTTSAGDAAGVKRAKDTLTYAIVGLVVAALAYAIVNFVVHIF